MQNQMGVLWADINPLLSEQKANRRVGEVVMRAYHDSAVNLPRFPFPNIDADSYLIEIDRIDPDFLRSLGENVRLEAGLFEDEGDFEKVAVVIARESNGGASLNEIMSLIIDPSKSVSWSSGISAPVSQIVENVGGGVVNLSLVIKYAPFVLVGAALIYFGYMAYRSGETVNKIGKLL